MQPQQQYQHSYQQQSGTTAAMNMQNAYSSSTASNYGVRREPWDVLSTLPPRRQERGYDDEDDRRPRGRGRNTGAGNGPRNVAMQSQAMLAEIFGQTRNAGMQPTGPPVAAVASQPTNAAVAAVVQPTNAVADLAEIVNASRFPPRPLEAWMLGGLEGQRFGETSLIVCLCHHWLTLST